MSNLTRPSPNWSRSEGVRETLTLLGVGVGLGLARALAPPARPAAAIPAETVAEWLETAKEARDQGESTDWHTALCSLAEAMEAALGGVTSGPVVRRST